VASVPLSDLLGTLVADLVRGESHAAQASLDFLRSVGFHEAKERPPDDWGPLRFIEFTFDAADEAGKLVPRRIRVPVLSLLPIPLQHVADAEYEFFVRVDDIQPAGLPVGAQPPKPPVPHAQITGDIAPFGDQANMLKVPRVRVKLSMKQADLPAGLSSSLRRIEQTSGEKP
jgi:uncharacterized protein DUF2589